MKYAVVLCDGMADYPLAELNGKTPMAAAHKPYMDMLAQNGIVGLVRTVPDGMIPGSDVANLSAMGYNPLHCYSGRSPLEAVSMGIKLAQDDVTVRCNLVTLSEEEPYEQKAMIDYCADDIPTQEAAVLIRALQEELGNDTFTFYPGVSYRHCVVWKKGNLDLGNLTAPHDFPGKCVGDYLPVNPAAAPLVNLMRRGYEILSRHPLNQARVKRGRRPANGIWLWGQGYKPRLTSFQNKFGLKGSVISAVDLIKGIGVCAKMDVCRVEGATGYVDTNFEGKAAAALDELWKGQDFVYIHLEAPDECGHRQEINHKVQSIEKIDQHVLRPLLEGLSQYEDYRIMVLPDHPTPLSLRSHTSDPVPFLIYQKSGIQPQSGISCFDEESAKNTGVYLSKGYWLMECFLGKREIPIPLK